MLKPQELFLSYPVIVKYDTSTMKFYISDTNSVSFPGGLVLWAVSFCRHSIQPSLLLRHSFSVLFQHLSFSLYRHFVSWTVLRRLSAVGLVNISASWAMLRPPLWSSYKEFLATDPEIPGTFPGATRFFQKQCVCNGVHSFSWG
jgi:hypothetical protein